MKDSLTSKLPSIILLSLSILVFVHLFSKGTLPYLASLIPLSLLFIRNKNILSTLSVFVFFISLSIFIYTIPINSFANFSIIALFTILLILLLISINSYFPFFVSLIILFTGIYASEVLGRGNFILSFLSFMSIIISLLINHIKDKDLFLWENRFLIRKEYKKGIIILFIIVISLSPLFLLTPKVRGIPIPKSLITVTPETEEVENPVYKPPSIEEEGKGFLSRIAFGKLAEKFLSFGINYIYVISLFGLLVFLILIMILIYRNIKNIMGKKKALIFLITSIVLSIGVFILLYLSYIPFTKFIKFIVSITGKGGIKGTGTTFNFSGYINKILKGGGMPQVRSTSIDLIVIISIIILSILSSITILLFVSYVYRETFGEKALRKGKISNEFRITPGEYAEENFSGTPREKIIKLYNLLIHKLRVIIGKNIYETPFEYKEKVLSEKPNISKEFNIITENFVISRYSNYNVDEGMWNSTIKAFINLKKKIFKEVINGG